MTNANVIQRKQNRLRGIKEDLQRLFGQMGRGGGQGGVFLMEADVRGNAKDFVCD